MTGTPLTGPSVWQGKDIANSRRWIRELTPDQVDELEAALKAVQALPWQEIAREDFPVPTLGDLIDDIADELENGCGIMKLKGFPVAGHGEDDLRRMYWGQAQKGGVSTLASTPAIHNAILARRPELLDALFTDYWRSRFGEEGTVKDGEGAPDVPKISEGQKEAIDMLMATAQELCFEMTLEPGDLQLINSHVTYRGRTPFEDEA